MRFTKYFLDNAQYCSLPHVIEIINQDMESVLHTTFAHVSQVERNERVHENLLDGACFGTFRRRVYYVFVIRFIADMSLTHYVRYEQKMFLLRQIIKLNEQNHFMKLMSMEV